ncbi:hypothetical protein Cgig2_028873 [Carnegiea gigantea]|uniref:Zinc finger GRF-type domain-containing protein n=1 Tax=Carnegiea gigantea TaxID=171969 RepID=A0A9Q1KRD2_9CARY|nr:hypothetical protein Cgig2_028873 [Carnegiea gigantea]
MHRLGDVFPWSSFTLPLPLFPCCPSFSQARSGLSVGGECFPFLCLPCSHEMVEGWIMEGSSSSRSKLASEDIAVCRRCNCEGMRKVSNSSQNPGRLYFKYLRCDKFLKWAPNEGPQERPVVVNVDIVKKELMEMRLMLKFIEKGQTLIVILLIVVIVLIAMVVVM